MQRWWVLYVDIFLLLYLYISTSFIGILSFGPGGLSKAFRGVFAPRVVSFFSFNTWTLINILGQNWWETRPSFYSGQTHLAIFCFRILPIPTIYIYIYMLNKASLLSENCRKPSLFVIWVLFKLIWEIEGRSEFRQHHCQNFVKKSKREERDMMWQKGKREKRNFGNGITELCAQKKRADLP